MGIFDIELRSINPDADPDAWVAAYFDSINPVHCEDCKYKSCWFERGENWAECEVKKATDCPAWQNIEDESDE